MGSLIDLTGQRFGRLVVLEYAKIQTGRNPKWLCRCDCGRLKEVAGRGLREGHVRSCGCLATEQRDKALKSKMRNVSNIDFSQVKERRSIPERSERRIEKLPKYVGKCLEEYGNTVLANKYAKIGSNNLVESIKRQFGYDVIVYMSSSDSLIVERTAGVVDDVKNDFDKITKRYP